MSFKAYLGVASCLIALTNILGPAEANYFPLCVNLGFQIIQCPNNLVCEGIINCKCPSNLTYPVANQDGKYSNCPAFINTYVQNGQLKCADGSTPNYSNHSCDCPNLTYFNNTKCTNYQGSYYNTSIHQNVCPYHSLADNTAKSCVCQEASYLKVNDTQCTPYQGAYLDPVSNSFKCPNNTHLDRDVQKCTCDTTEVDGNVQCQCDGASYSPNTTGVCLGYFGSFYNVSTGNYECPPGSHQNGANNVCGCGELDGDTCNCQGASFEAQVLEGVDFCHPYFYAYYDVLSEQFKCPNGTVTNLSNCALS